jgi:hypothetical protein
MTKNLAEDVAEIFVMESANHALEEEYDELEVGLVRSTRCLHVVYALSTR